MGANAVYWLMAATAASGAYAASQSGKTPAPPEAPAPLESPPSRVDPSVVQNAERDRIRRKRGRLATMLSGPQGDISAPQVGVKQLLGS